MSYVIGRGIVMFGGTKQTAPFSGAKNDTWLCTANGWAEVKPATPPTARRLHALAVHPVNIVQAVLFGGSVGGAETHTFSLGSFAPGTYTAYGKSCVGSNGCALQTDIIMLPLMATAGATASLSLPIPNQSTLVGVTYYNQAFVLDKGSATLSNGAAATIGRR